MHPLSGESFYSVQSFHSDLYRLVSGSVQCLLYAWQTEIIRKRLHKDIGHHPVIMLNFCPDLKTAHPDLRMAQGEFIFLIDRSGSMSGTNINRVKVTLQFAKVTFLIQFFIVTCTEIQWNAFSPCYSVKSYYTWVLLILFWNSVQRVPMFRHHLVSSKPQKSLILAQKYSNFLYSHLKPGVLMPPEMHMQLIFGSPSWFCVDSVS